MTRSIFELGPKAVLMIREGLYLESKDNYIVDYFADQHNS